MLVVGQALACSGDVGVLVFDLAREFVDVLVGQLDFEILEVYLLGQQVKFAVVAHVVDLILIAGDKCFAVFYLGFFGAKVALEFGNLGSVIVDAGVEACDTVFEVLDFEG